MGECYSTDPLAITSQSLVGKYLKDADRIVQQKHVMHRSERITELWPFAPEDVPKGRPPGRLYVICHSTDELIEAVQ